jgi:hypothetical protein
MEKRIDRLKTLGCPVRKNIGFKRVERRRKRIARCAPPRPIFVEGIESGALYAVGFSMKRHGPGYVNVFACFSGKDGGIPSPVRHPQIVMTEPRADDVWQKGEILVRAPKGAEKLHYDIAVEISEGSTLVEMRDFTVYKIGDPLPEWPTEKVREKERK